jgi:hypothetical protein
VIYWFWQIVFWVLKRSAYFSLELKFQSCSSLFLSFCGKSKVGLIRWRIIICSFMQNKQLVLKCSFGHFLVLANFKVAVNFMVGNVAVLNVLPNPWLNCDLRYAKFNFK